MLFHTKIIVLVFLMSSLASCMAFSLKLNRLSHSNHLTRSIKSHGSPKSALKMVDIDVGGMLDGSPSTYVGLFLVTLVPSLAIVKFIGDSADDSRGNLSDKTKKDFKRRMMQQPNLNLSIPTTEEEELKKQIAKAYMQDKDVDVAVLEEKLRKRAQWRKELMMEKRAESQSLSSDDDDGW